jgi:hypothetical protein
MDKMPQGFNWVKAKAECSSAQVFTEFRLGVEDDIEEINKLRGGSVEKDVRLAPNGNGNTFVVLRGNKPEPSIRFSLTGNEIRVLDGSGTPLATYEVSLSEEGRCVLTQNGIEKKQWQARRAALEGLFFNS